MPIDVYWLLENRVVAVVMHGEITVDHIVNYDEALIQMIESSPATMVHTIIDVSRITQNASMRDTLRAKAPYHKNAGWGVTVGATVNPMVRLLTSVAVGLAKVRYRDVKTFNEALEFLQKQDSSLPDLSFLARSR